MIHLLDGMLAAQKALKTGTLESDPTVYRGVVHETELPKGNKTWSEFLRAEKADSCKVAILLHGSFCDSRMYPEDFVDFIRGQGFHVLAIDHRGFGRSSWCRKEPLGVTDLARDAFTVLRDVLGHEDLREPTHLLAVGHSVGGYIVEELLRLHCQHKSGLGTCTASALLLCTAPWPEVAEGRYYKPKALKFLEQYAVAMLPREKFFSWWRISESAKALEQLQKAVADFPEMRSGSEFPETAEVYAAEMEKQICRGSVNLLSPIPLEVVQKQEEMLEVESWSLVKRVIIVHGHADQIFTWQAAEDLEKRWQQRSIESVLKDFPGQGHMLQPSEWKRLQTALSQGILS
mmetsp:Transcript_5906/g.10548  ORF Transcript_5906/g.10548 Transcript_5906/m.10548 type:complete len:346 (+) Transcript_5906:83-1120(+)